MILYVLYEDFLDGDCSYPKAVVDNISIAEKWRKKSEGNGYMELELNDLSGLRVTRTYSRGGNVDIEEMIKSSIRLKLSEPIFCKKITNL